MIQKISCTMKEDISNNIKNVRGFTLIEVIVSVAIIGIIATSVLTLLGYSLKSVIISDNRTDNILDIEEEIDMKIEDYKNEGTRVIKVKIPNLSIEKEIKGDVLEKQYKDTKIKIQTFIPNED